MTGNLITRDRSTATSNVCHCYRANGCASEKSCTTALVSIFLPTNLPSEECPFIGCFLS